MDKLRVLELRIHGIANAPPAEMLCTTQELVERKDGDNQGSFWQITAKKKSKKLKQQPTAEAVATAQAVHSTADSATPTTAAKKIKGQREERPTEAVSTGPTGFMAPDSPIPIHEAPKAELSQDGSPRANAAITAEAYSWGNQARSGGSALALIGRAVIHITWLFVLPFGLCNLAYWARRDIKGTDESRRWWDGGDGTVSVRVFALLQTLFYTVGFLTVSVYLMGLQCFRVSEGGSPRETCAALPGWLDVFAEWSVTSRAALFSIVPIAVLLLIYIVGRRARGMYSPRRSFNDEDPTDAEEGTNVDVHQDAEADRGKPPTKSKDSDPPRPPLLASAGFWERSRVAQTSERAHLAAALALVVFLLASNTLLAAYPAADPMSLLLSFPEVFEQDPIPAAGSAAGGVLLAGAFVIAIAAGLTGRVWSIRSKRGWSAVLLILSALAYVSWILWAVFSTWNASPEDPYAGVSEFRGLIVTPTVIAAVCALIAVASLSWGYGWRRNVVRWTLVPLALISVILAELWAKDLGVEYVWVRPVLSAAAVLFVALAIAVAYLPFRDPEVKAARRLTAWHGNGAAVALLIALFSSLVITSLLVLGAHAWLTADNDSPDVTDSWRTVAASSGTFERPAFFERFASMLVIMLVVLILFAGVGAIGALRRFPAFSLPGLAFPRDLPKDDVRRAHDMYLGGTKQPGEDYPPSETGVKGRLRAIVDARRVAGLAHRGEPMLRVLAILTALSLVPLAIPALGELLDGTSPLLEGTDNNSPEPSAIWNTVSAASGWALGLLALAAVAWVVTNAITSTERPLGLVWDIICFFPRAGHPFTPPCYAERAVPELIKRVKHWLTEEGGDTVVLSAHSMGATLAIGAIFALHDQEKEQQIRERRLQRGQPEVVADTQRQQGLSDAEEGISETGMLEAGDRYVEKIALLTHGVQLRAYFSRFFPEVFGARVLGVRGTTGPQLASLDPWQRQVIGDYLPPTEARPPRTDPISLVRLLGGDLRNGEEFSPPRWRSLWRRTDFLGFPVHNYWSNQVGAVNENPIDRGATERSPRTYLWTVARHNDYISTLQYEAALDELIEMMKRDRESGRASVEPRPTEKAR